MNTATKLITAACFLGAAQYAIAQPGPPDGERPRRMPPPELVEQFDTDLDGELSPDERALMHEELKLRAEEFKLKMLDRFDADGDGELSKDERQIARKTMKAELLTQYDTDKDGQLSESERKAAASDGALPPRRMKGADGRRGQKGKRGQRGERAQRGERGERFSDEMALAGPGNEGCQNGECPKGEKGARGQRGPRGQRAERGQRRGKEGRRLRMSPEDLQKFDTDGDGQLSKSERTAAKAEMKTRFRQRMAEFDADGDGEVSPDEKAAARKAFSEQRRAAKTQKRVTNAIDADNDGLIDPDELANALEKIRLGDGSMDLNADGSVDEKDTLLLIQQNFEPKPE